MTWGIFKKDSVSEAYAKMKAEELNGKQHKLDVNKNGKVDGDDLAKLRATKEEVENVEEGWDDMLKYVKDKNGPQPNGGSGKKQGTRYGGQKQKEDESEKRKEQNEEVESVDEARRANTNSARAELSNRPRKPPTEQETAQRKKDEDEAWERLMAHAASQKKESVELDIFSEKDLEVLINEVLSKDQPAGKWIQDFVKSDDPKFAGDSKKQRIKRALGAYYGAQRNESTDYDAFVVLDEEKQADIVKMGAKEIKHANMKDKQQDAEVMEPHSQGEQDFLDNHSILVTDDPTRDKQDGGASKLGKASEPAGKGPGSYDAKEKLGNQKTGVKEETYKTAAGEEIDTEPAEKKAGDKKKFSSFKATVKNKAAAADSTSNY